MGKTEAKQSFWEHNILYNQFMKILDNLCDEISKKMEYSDLENQLLRHGVDIFLCDGTDFLSAILISFFLHNTIQTITYIITFALLRRNAGGWHAKTPILCLVIYLIHYFLAVMFIEHVSLKPIFYVLSFGVSALYVYLNAPVQHPNQPLCDEEKERAKKAVLRLLVVYLVLALLSFIFNTVLFKILIIVTVYCAIAMILLAHQSRKLYEN